MAYEIVHKEDDGGIITIYSGTVTDEDLCESLRERLRDKEKIKLYKYAISDCLQVTDYKVSPEGLKENADMAVEASKFNPHLVVAVIVPSDFMFGMGRMWETYMDDAGWKTIMVKSYEHAYQWIKHNMHKPEEA